MAQFDETWQCPFCKAKYCYLFDQVSHIRKAHNGCTNSRKLSCPVNGCSKVQFVNTSTYYKHVRKFHHDLYFERLRQKYLTFNSYMDTEAVAEDQSEHDEFPAAGSDTDMQDCSYNGLSVRISYNELEEDYQAVAARALLKLKSDHRLSQHALDDIIQMNTDITQSLNNVIKLNTLDILRKHNVSVECYQEVQAQLDKLNEPFEGLHTAHLQKKYISTNFPYIVSACMHAVCALNKHHDSYYYL